MIFTYLISPFVAKNNPWKSTNRQATALPFGLYTSHILVYVSHFYNALYHQQQQQQQQHQQQLSACLYFTQHAAGTQDFSMHSPVSGIILRHGSHLLEKECQAESKRARQQQTD
jgi:hypothetical protein